MMFKMTLISTLMTGLMGSSITMADTQSEMQSWYNSMGSMANISGSQVVHGQTSTTYTGGSAFIRSPVKNLNPISIQAPSITGGCGGIDLFAGAFSFANSAQLQAMIKNIGTNAINYGFMLAIETASPQMAAQLKWLQDQIAKVNAMSLNSCKAAEGIVNAVTPQSVLDGAHSAGMQGTGTTVSSLWPDSLGALQSWNSYDAQQKAAALKTVSATDPNLAASLNPGNIVFNALQKANAPTDMYPLMMGLTGAVIMNPPGSTNNSTGTTSTATYVTDTSIKFEDFIGDPGVQTTSITGLSCDDMTVCLNPSASSMNVESLSYDINQVITKGVTQITNRSAQNFTASDNTLFTNTTIPLYKVARIAYMNGNTTLASNYAQLIAIDLASQWMTSVLRQVNQALKNTNKTTLAPSVTTSIKQLTDQIDKELSLAAISKQTAYHKLTTEMAATDNLKKINDEMMNAFKPSIQNSVIRFSQR